MQAIEFNYNSQDGVIKIQAQELPHNIETQHRLPKGVGCYHSGRSDISRRAEELLFQKLEEKK